MPEKQNERFGSIGFLNKPSRTTGALILLVALSLLCTPWVAAQEEDATVPAAASGEQVPYRILYLNLRSELWPWLIAMSSETRDHLERLTGAPVELIVENTTIADVESPATREAFKTLFRERYSDNIDFIVVRRQFPQIDSIVEVLPDVPVIVTDQNLALAREWETPPANVHEVRYEIRVDSIAEAALQMRPQTQKIVVIAGLDPYDQSLETSAREQLGESYNGVGVEYWSGVPVPELVERVATLPDDHVVLFLATTVDENGALSVSADVVKQLSAASSVPLFGIADTFIPDGIVGGYVLSSEASGRRAAEMMNQLLRGEALPGLSYVEDYGEYQFDWQQMIRWGIAEERLPAEAKVLNRPDSYFERNTWVLPALGVVAVSLVLAIGLLFWYLRMRRLVDRALLASEERLIEAQRMARMGDFTWDVETGEVTWSDAMYDLLRYEKSEKVDYAQINIEIHHPDDLERVTQWLNDCIVSGSAELTPNEYRIIRKDGRILYVRTVGVIQRTAGRPTRVFATLQDITERKQAEEALQKSEEKFRGIFEQSPIAIQLYDKSGGMIDVNPQTLKIYGLEDKTYILGYDMWSSPFLTEETTGALKDGKQVFIPAHLDFDLVRRTQLFPTERTGIIYLEMHAIPLVRGQENIGFLVQMIDVTERKEMEAKFLQTQKMESIGRLAGGIAHDFNNILVPIIGYVELAMLNLNPDDKLNLYLKRVQEAADRATRLTQQILAFSRKQVLQMQVLDPNAIVLNFEKMLQRLIGEDVRLETFLDPALYRVNADAGQIEQVLMNLAVNARDAMPAGGSLTIETTNVYLDDEYIKRCAGAQSPGHYVMLAVSDTGCGMDAATRQQIFEPFFTTKERGKGTGLGLSTVFGIVKQHGGNIWVYSEPDKGTTFKIYLPRADGTHEAIETKATEPASVFGRETILVVEDEAMVRQLVCESLASHGYEILEARGAREALRLASECKGTIALLLTDVIMPEMNGRELHLSIAAINPDIRVLYMSGYTENVIVHHGIPDEGVNFLQKPFTVQDLAQKVRQALS